MRRSSAKTAERTQGEHERTLYVDGEGQWGMVRLCTDGRLLKETDYWHEGPIAWCITSMGNCGKQRDVR